jgi:SAM-dependent MidA family methyltransferase
VDLTRIPRPESSDDSDPELLEALRAEIRRDGPITFARFMEIALYDPARGYYRGTEARPGRAGDFLTSPEAHPLFGRAIGRFAAAVHAALGAPATFAIRESGAGTGALALPLVETIAGSDAHLETIRYLVDEIEPARLQAVGARLRSAAIPPHVRVDTVADDEAPIDGLHVANEVVDALPTHRVVQRGRALRELRVAIGPGGAIVDAETEPSPGLPERLSVEGVALEDGQQAEICLALDAWMARAASGLGTGVLLVIDYGHPAADLYDRGRRPEGTLATYRGHAFGSDPFVAIGRQDITAHVDFTAMERAAEEAGLARLGATTQGPFLAGLGVGDLLVAEQTAPGHSLQGYLEARSALVRMIDPAAMGGFRVVAFGRGLPDGVALPGLGRLPRTT